MRKSAFSYDLASNKKLVMSERIMYYLMLLWSSSRCIQNEGMTEKHKSAFSYDPTLSEKLVMSERIM